MSLEGLCAEWVKKNFNRVVQIREAIVLEQDEIDKVLNLVLVECDFSDKKGEEGYTIAFLDAHDVLLSERKASSGSSFSSFFPRLVSMETL